jgi:hypothetical protein
LQQGRTEAKIVELAKRTGEKLPPKIANKPRIDHGLEIYWKAFWECSRDRNVGMGEGPLPWSSVHTWGNRFGFVEEEFDRLVYILFKMDSAYMEERSKQQEKKIKSGSKGGRSKAPIRTRKK